MGPTGTTKAVNGRAGSGSSTHVERAVQRQIERHNLAELVSANEEIHGPLTSEEIEVAQAEPREVGHRASERENERAHPRPRLRGALPVPARRPGHDGAPAPPARRSSC